MADVTFDEVVRLADQLSLVDKRVLIAHLQNSLPHEQGIDVTREGLIAELEQLRTAGAFDHAESLYGKFANPNIDLSEEELHAYLHQVASEWEEEMNEFLSDT